MKKLAFILLTIIICSCSNSIEKNSEGLEFSGRETFPINSEIAIYEGKPYSGEIYENYESGEIKRKIQFKDGKRSGLDESFYESVEREILLNREKEEYLDTILPNRKKGIIEWENNIAKSIKDYNGYFGGNYIELMREYDENGNRIKMFKYNSNGQVTSSNERGQIRTYDEEGNLISERYVPPPPAVSMSAAENFMIRTTNNTNQTLMRKKETKFDNTIIYAFLSVSNETGLTCLSIISENKLEIISTNCGDTNKKVREFNNL